MSFARILAIDTATRTLGVALGGEGGWWLGAAERGAGRGEAIVEVIRRGLAEVGWRGADLDGIAVASGPGSYTGLRVGLAVAKTLAWAWQKPLVGVDTLAAMALAVGWAAPVVVAAIDARRGEVFGGVFAGGGEPPVESLEPSRALPVDELAAAAVRHARARGAARAAAVGDGCHRYAATLAASSELEYIWVPESLQLARPVAVGRLGRWWLARGRRDDPVTLGARYLKTTEAESRWQPPRS
ncbi:MAG TPA: tRNA (adenosine(37)-N6)-threonylcarbamoyltransferase complex dimerization subunit type 1 TsaB [Limnochordales bacterium]